jgi:hypothetical protein
MGLILAMTAAGKSRDGVDSSPRAASCSGARVISREARLERSCSIVRAPMSVDVTAGRLRTHASATSAELGRDAGDRLDHIPLALGGLGVVIPSAVRGRAVVAGVLA